MEVLAGRPGQGLHSLRNLQATIIDNLRDHRLQIEEWVQEAVKRAEESAVERSQALFGPAFQSLQIRIATDVPELKSLSERLFEDSQLQLQHARTATTSHIERLDGRIDALREDLRSLTELVHGQGNEIASVQNWKHDLWKATSDVQASVLSTTNTLEARVQAVIQDFIRSQEHNFGKLSTMTASVESCQLALKEINDRTSRCTQEALDACGAFDVHLENRIESLRLDAYEEAKKQAAESTEKLRSEVLKENLQESFDRKLRDFEAVMVCRVQEYKADILKDLHRTAEESIAKNEQFAVHTVAEMSANMSEALEGLRFQNDRHERRLTQALDQWRSDLQDTQRNANATAAISQESLSSFAVRLGNVADTLNRLQLRVSEEVRNSKEGREGIRAELQEETAKWKAFEDVGIPRLLSLVDKKADESEGRTLRTTLDYAERLRRLPAVSCGGTLDVTLVSTSCSGSTAVPGSVPTSPSPSFGKSPDRPSTGATLSSTAPLPPLPERSH